MNLLGKTTVLQYLKAVWWPILALTLLFSFRWLFDSNMGVNTVNEANMLPFARQQLEPGWIPQDWYLNQPPGYRVPFIQVFGRLAIALGFLQASIVGRLLEYVALASGLVFLSRQLKLSTPLLILAMDLFLFVNTALFLDSSATDGAGSQGAVAREWMVGGIEPKALAYTFILYALGLMFTGRWLWMALLLGCATSFHTLVGGWAVVSVTGWLLLRRRSLLLSHGQRLGGMLLLYLIGSAFAIQPIVQQLTGKTPKGLFSASFTYVYLRTPHHLNPLSWHPLWWVKPLILLAVLGWSVWVLWQQARRSGETQSPEHQARLGLAEFALISLGAFVVGLIVAPLEQADKFLQYYPFRFGDLMLPLSTCLLLCCALEQTFTSDRARKRLLYGCILMVVLTCSLRFPETREDFLSLRKFPSKEQQISVEEKALYGWLYAKTPRDAVIVSSPADLAAFSWMTERATIAKFRLVPPTSAGIAEWLQRLTDLGGSIDPWADVQRTKDQRNDINDRLEQGYDQLTTEQAVALMDKYNANYIVTKLQHQLELPLLYFNEEYRIYAKSNAVR